MGPVPHFTFDMNLAMNSLRKLTGYDIEAVICYHGGMYRNHVNQRIGELVKEY